MVGDKLRNGNFSKSQVCSEICKNEICVNQRDGEDWIHQRCTLSICFSKSSLQLTIKVKSNSVVFDKKMNRGRGSWIDNHQIKISNDGPNLEGNTFMVHFFSLPDLWREFRIITSAFKSNIESHLLDSQSVFSWSNILMAVPQRSGLESRGHSVTAGKTILSIGKVSTTDFMGFSIQSASTNLIFIYFFIIAGVRVRGPWPQNPLKPKKGSFMGLRTPPK